MMYIVLEVRGWSSGVSDGLCNKHVTLYFVRDLISILDTCSRGLSTFQNTQVTDMYPGCRIAVPLHVGLFGRSTQMR